MTHLRSDEGVYVNHPRDPGGATNHGITQAVYDAFRKRLGLAVRSVKLITEAEVAAIYQTQYADKVRYNDLPAGVDYATLDAPASLIITAAEDIIFIDRVGPSSPRSWNT